MKNYLVGNIFWFILVVLFSSCNKENKISTNSDLNFGESEYFNSFLGYHSDTVILEKRIKLQLSDYAIKSNAKIQFALVDEAKQTLHDDIIKVFVNGEKQTNGNIVFSSLNKLDTIIIGLQILPANKQEELSGYLSLISSDFDRINHTESIALGQPVLPWRATYDLKYNPLAKGLVVVLALIVISLVIWFLILRKRYYPRLNKSRMEMRGELTGISYKKYRKVVVYSNVDLNKDKRDDDKLLNKIFKGTVLYLEAPKEFSYRIVFTGIDNRRIKVKTKNCYLKPPASKLNRGEKYEVFHDNREKLYDLKILN